MIENYAAGEKNVLIWKIQQMDEVKQTRRGVQHAPITVEGEGGRRKGGGGGVFNPKGFIQPLSLKQLMRNKQDNMKEAQGA